MIGTNRVQLILKQILFIALILTIGGGQPWITTYAEDLTTIDVTFIQAGGIDNNPTGNTYKNPVSFKMGNGDKKQIKDAVKEGHNFFGWILDA